MRGGDFSEEALTQLEVQVKYSGYIAKEKNNADKISRLEHVRIPEGFSYGSLKSLSYEARKVARYTARLGCAGFENKWGESCGHICFISGFGKMSFVPRETSKKITDWFLSKETFVLEYHKDLDSYQTRVPDDLFFLL